MTTDVHTKLETGLQEHKSEREADKREGGETRLETTAEKNTATTGTGMRSMEDGEEAFLQQWTEIV